MIFQRFYYPYLAVYSYLIGDEKTKTCVIVDPIRYVNEYVEAAKHLDLRITGIIETHVHADFVSGAKELKNALEGSPVIYCSSMGGENWIPAYADHLIKDGDQVTMGTVHLKACHTPGHSPEHLIWIGYDGETDSSLPCFAMTGDLLLVGGVGRPDILGDAVFLKQAESLYRSLFETLSVLPDFLTIFPGHGHGSACGDAVSTRPFSTLGYERKTNKDFLKLPLQEWMNVLKNKMPKLSPSFIRIKRYNLQGPAVLQGTFPKEIQAITNDKHQFLLDIRSKEQFAEGHPKNAVNIGWGPNFGQWASWIVPSDEKIIIIYDDSKALFEAVKMLHLLAFDQLAGCIKYAPQKDDQSFPLLPSKTLAKYHKESPENFLVVDVRTPQEWEDGHIPGAEHIEVESILEESSRLPKDALVSTICRSGYRASIAASLLQKAGFTNVNNVEGGMQAWISNKLPITKK